jgi:hypothetical protein
MRLPLFASIVLTLLVACGQTQESELASRTAHALTTIARPTPTPLPHPAVPTADAAIQIARGVVSPYIATWQDVVAVEESGVWRVQFRHYETQPTNAPPIEDYYRIPLSVFIDAQTGIVLRQGYV